MGTEAVQEHTGVGLNRAMRTGTGRISPEALQMKSRGTSQTNPLKKEALVQPRARREIGPNSGIFNRFFSNAIKQTSNDTAIQAITGTFGYILLFNGIFSFHIANGKITDSLTLIEIVVGSIFLISSVFPLPIHPATKYVLVIIAIAYFVVSSVTLHDSASKK